MPAIVNERKVGPVTLLELGTRLTIEEVSELSEAVTTLVTGGCQALLLDCSRVTFIDSRGVGALVRNWVSVKQHGGKLKLFGLQPHARDVLQITGLLKLMDCFEDIGSALRSF